tara:strand:+ start:6690 stop:9200 length:2511 start_codon:yes stop_codon:yes gene_type:complete
VPESSKELVSLLAPADLLAGLGAADRPMLASSLALLDDSTLMARLGDLAGKAGAQLSKLKGASVEDASSLLARQQFWLESTWSDDTLRVALYLRLRAALDLAPRLSATLRGCHGLADDLTARLIHVLDPPGVMKTGKGWLRAKGWLAEGERATTLADVVMPVLDEIMADALQEHADQPDPAQRRAMLREAIINMAACTPAEQQRLLEAARSDHINDAALRNMLLLGGGLSAFSASVSVAGFSAYIMAAQASAFIPMVSGPGLVSFVSVLSNPVTVVAATAGAVWWFGQLASQRVNTAIAARLAAMFTIRGVQSGRGAIESLLRAFCEQPDLDHLPGISRDTAASYRQEQELLGSILSAEPHGTPSDLLKQRMQVPVGQFPPAAGPNSNPAAGKNGFAGNEGINAAAMGTLTVGDILYSAAAIDPTVLRAADFASVAEVEGRVAFADLARNILESAPNAVVGHTSRLKGYVAEKAVASELTAAGHVVSFPDAANQPGWDLLVDGQPFQVKFHASVEGVSRHFERYDYPVIAGSDLQGKVPEHLQDQVFFVDGLNTELVEQITAQSLQAGADMLEPSAVNAAGTVSALRGLMAYRSGHLSGQQALEQVLLDGSVRVSLASTGGVAGAVLGGLAFGPAGAWVFGAGAPVLAQMQTTRVTELVRRHVKGDRHAQWEAQAHETLNALQQAVTLGLRNKRLQIARKMAQAPDNEAGHWLRWRLADDGRFAAECERRLAAISQVEFPIPEQRLTSLLRLIASAGVHPFVYQVPLRAVNQVMPQRPGLKDLVSDVQASDTARRAKGLYGTVMEKGKSAFATGRRTLANKFAARRSAPKAPEDTT